ncbi:cyclin A2 [Striga asiatica]|uniref:Cyclin A2 n=1 Tax=Striga asiatica TaxID=4170 RepID=A0A5A7PM06_STRAF|nr:cyclin A2 [Striga asiatica]
MRRAVLNKENMSSYPTIRITRARAKALHPLEKKPGDKVLRKSTKRASCSDKKTEGLDGCLKKRAVLKDVTNVTRQNELRKRDTKVSLQTEGKVAPACIAKMPQIQDDKRESTKIVSVKNLPTEITELVDRKLLRTLSPILEKTNPKNAQLCKEEENSDDTDIIDIDTRHKDPQLCSPYVDDIYHNMYTAELNCRPALDYMESMQRFINHDMRAILVDWLVEKIRKIYAPSVEEFCFITDNTYTKDEVVKMESRVLNCLSFHLSVPTTKKFLRSSWVVSANIPYYLLCFEKFHSYVHRRFIHAAQVSYEAPLAELEFLANYLAELTLQEYSFLKFLPSQIAPSAVFLARWTLDQSNHPWNSTLEHYTRYKTTELKNSVSELQELQLNTRGCLLKAIREKYKQPKFKCVSTLCSSRPVQSLF